MQKGVGEVTVIVSAHRLMVVYIVLSLMKIS